MEPDELLIRRIINGDKEAFRHIVESYRVFVYTICYNVIRDHHEAENLAQETFIKSYNSLSQYHLGSFKNWIARIAVNTAIDLKRRLNAQKEVKIISIDNIGDIADNNRSDIIDDLVEKEKKSRISLMCGELPKKYGDVLKKYYIESKSYQEIAKEEGISIRTVETRLYRAKKLFKRRWSEDERYKAL